MNEESDSAGNVKPSGRMEGLLRRLSELEARNRALERALHEMEQSRREWLAVVDAVPDPIFIHDKDLRIVRANRAYAACAGRDFKDIIGKPYWEVFPQTAGPLAVCARTMQQAEEEEEEEEEEELQLTTGETFLVRSHAMRAAANRLFSLHILRDITAHKRAEEALRRTYRAFRTLSACNQALVRATDEQALLRDMCRAIVEVGGYRLAWVGWVEHDAAKSVRPVAHAGYEAGYLETAQLTWADTERGRGPAGLAIRGGEPQAARDIRSDPRYAPWRAQALRRGYASSLALPLKKEDGEVFAVLSVYAAEPDAFEQEEIGLLQELAEDLAFGLLTLRTRAERDRLQEEYLRSGERIKAALTGTIRAIALTVEKRDPYTAGHQQRVAELCVAIGGELGLDPDHLEGLRLGALIHDIGKISIPAEILSRPGGLTDVEFELIKSHPEVGYDIVKDVKFPWPVGEMILQHHERLDGSGYPKALKGDAIILEARILAVADTVEAMSSHRPYRPAHGLDAALAEIAAHRGTRYDAAAVEACLRLFREKNFSLGG